jgi:hypothetical protein
LNDEDLFGCSWLWCCDERGTENLLFSKGNYREKRCNCQQIIAKDRVMRTEA